MTQIRWIQGLAVALVLSCWGCTPSSEPTAQEVQEQSPPVVADTKPAASNSDGSSAVAQSTPPPAAVPAPAEKGSGQRIDRSEIADASAAGSKAPRRSRSSSREPDPTLEGSSPEKIAAGVLERVDAARMVVTELQKSTEYAPTLVVWLIDRSASCREMVNDFGRLTQVFSQEMLSASGGDEKEARLLSAVVTFGSDVQFVVDPPVASLSSMSDAIRDMPQDATGKELTFTAIKQSLEKFLPYRTQQQREVLFIIVSDEAGDDAEMVDQLIDGPRRAAVPFYVVGVPAPFGKVAALTAQAEAGLDYKPTGNWHVIRQGPESRELERIRLGYWGGSVDLDTMDSGFGPFALEWMCRATGGRYLALRPDASEFTFVSALNTQWPSPGAPRFNPEVMRRYAPDYVSAAEYRGLIAANKAKQALFDAAQLGEVELSEFPQTSFKKSDEATMAKMLSQAQQVAAKLEPMANRWYESLEKGEADRNKLREPRWQAGFDLAIGRAAAVKAKVDGYNAMLAALKRGKTFQNPESTAWVLEPADSVEGASALQKLIDKSKMYLTRVTTEHAGTPWAKLAEKELETPSGWKWVER